MSRVLLDENVPVGLRALLVGHDVFTADFMGWKGLVNGRLLHAAEEALFDVFVTADQNVRFQQRLAGRTLAMIILSSTNWNDIRRAPTAIREAVDRAEAGGVVSVLNPGPRDRPEDNR